MRRLKSWTDFKFLGVYFEAFRRKVSSARGFTLKENVLTCKYLSKVHEKGNELNFSRVFRWCFQTFHKQRCCVLSFNVLFILFLLSLRNSEVFLFSLILQFSQKPILPAFDLSAQKAHIMMLQFVYLRKRQTSVGATCKTQREMNAMGMHFNHHSINQFYTNECWALSP